MEPALKPHDLWCRITELDAARARIAALEAENAQLRAELEAKRQQLAAVLRVVRKGRD